MAGNGYPASFSCGKGSGGTLCLARVTARRIHVGHLQKKADILMTSPCLSVVIPVCNEENTLARVVERLTGVPHLLEIAIVQDAEEASISGLKRRRR